MRSVSGDTQSIVRAHGQSRIAAVKVIATGDLIIDGVRIWALGKAEDKTWGGK
jgi:hypothetical protein